MKLGQLIKKISYWCCGIGVAGWAFSAFGNLWSYSVMAIVAACMVVNISQS